MGAKRNYRDSLFRRLFNNKKYLLSVYNALEGASLTSVREIKITTLKGTFFNDVKNDISFLAGGRYIVLLEHQSTVNENMPLRCLFYIARLYQQQIDRDLIYRSKRMAVPTPKFYVFYNGNQAEPDKRVMSLSEAFPDKDGMLDLQVVAYNVNAGKNKELLAKCKVLREYSIFNGMVKGKTDTGMSLEQALRETIEYCLHHDILKEFLQENAKEVLDMVSMKWDWKEAERVWREEAREAGLAEGMTLGREKERENTVMNRLQRFVKKGIAADREHLAEIAEDSSLSMSRVIELAKKCGVAVI